MDCHPGAGREQTGRRPGLVVSAEAYNRRVGLALVCPITSRMKGYTFEVELPAQTKITGVVLADHVRSVDWNERQAEFAGRVSDELLDQVLERIEALLRS